MGNTLAPLSVAAATTFGVKISVNPMASSVAAEAGDRRRRDRCDRPPSRVTQRHRRVVEQRGELRVQLWPAQLERWSRHRLGDDRRPSGRRARHPRAPARCATTVPSTSSTVSGSRLATALAVVGVDRARPGRCRCGRAPARRRPSPAAADGAASRRRGLVRRPWHRARAASVRSIPHLHPVDPRCAGEGKLAVPPHFTTGSVDGLIRFGRSKGVTPRLRDTARIGNAGRHRRRSAKRRA